MNAADNTPGPGPGLGPNPSPVALDPENVDDALLDLLATRATEPISEEQTRQLIQAGLNDADDFDLAAAAFDLALCEQSGLQDMPEGLAANLANRAAGFGPPTQTGPASAYATNTATSASPAVIGKIAPSGYLGWAAAAVMTIVASIGWLRPPATDSSLNAQTLYTALTASTSDTLVQADWGAINAEAHPDFSGVSGEIVFDPETQQGVMRFVGLPKNRPSNFQYQLWIVDPTRDTEPVDGGVFDADADGEIYVLVNAKLLAQKPQAFVITVEHPGGVVESETDNYRLLAQPADPPAISG